MKCHKCDMHMENVYLFDEAVNGSCDCTSDTSYAAGVMPVTWGAHPDYFINLSDFWNVGWEE